MIKKIISFIGLGLTLIPAFLVYLGMVDLDTHKSLMLLGTLIWFATAPAWINRPSEPAAEE